MPLRGTAGARHGRGARHFLGGRRSAAPAEQPARPGRRLQPAPRPALSIAAGGRVASQSHSIMRGKLERIVFSDATAAIFVEKATKGTRSTKRHNTKGRNGKDKISLWRELIDMIEDKGLAVSAALDLLAASEILSSAALNHRKKWISIEFGLASRKTSCLRLLLCSRSALVS